MTSDPKLAEAVRIVREQTIPALAGSGGGGHVAALEAVLSALSRRSEEWEAVVAALGPHAHPGLSPSGSVAEVVVKLDATTDKLSSVTEDYLKERNAATAAEAERDALRAEVERRKALAAATQLECNRLAVSLSDEIEAHRTTAAAMHEFEAGEERAEAALMDALYDCALTYDAAGDLDYLSRAVEAEAALLRHVERDHTEALKIEAQREEDYKTHGPWCRCAGCMRLWPTNWKLPVRAALRDTAPAHAAECAAASLAERRRAAAGTRPGGVSGAAREGKP